jgi:hypothetical protein
MAMPVHVFRVLKGAQAARDDFLSDEARRKRPRDVSADGLGRHRGFSVWRTEEQARTVARRFPRLGTHVAEVELPLDARLLPFPEAPGHQTAFGDPDAFVRGVVRIVPVN